MRKHVARILRRLANQADPSIDVWEVHRGDLTTTYTRRADGSFGAFTSCR